MNMKNMLNIMVDIDDLALVTAVLKPSELARLLKALAAHMAGKEDIEQYLSNSGVRLAFAMLRPSIDESLQRLATNRVNGAKGGRPRRKSAPEMTIPADETEEKPTKKSKKEDLTPTPPIEEKNKKNLVVDVVDSRENENFEKEILNNSLRVEQACMSLDITPDEYRQMARAVLNDWEFTEESDRSYKHLLNSLRIKVREHSRQKRHCYGANSRIQHDITDTSATCAKDYEGPF